MLEIARFCLAPEREVERIPFVLVHLNPRANTLRTIEASGVWGRSGSHGIPSTAEVMRGASKSGRTLSLIDDTASADPAWIPV